MPPPRVKAMKPVIEVKPVALPVVNILPVVVDGEIPPQPKLDPMLGNHTPAYKIWLKSYYPDEYKRKFGGE